MVEAIEGETRQTFEVLRDSSSPMCTWEIKSTTAGSDEVMIAVSGLGDFNWTRYAGVVPLTSSIHQQQQENVALAVVGPDAEDPCGI